MMPLFVIGLVVLFLMVVVFPAQRRQKKEQDAMALHVECAKGSDLLANSVAETLQAVTKLKGAVVFAKPGSLPNDGKVIEDLRKYG